MKKLIFLITLVVITFNLSAQSVITIPNPNDSRVITTGVPFILIAGDARSAGIGNIGVTTSADAFSQQWNASKNAFAISKQGIGVTYTPYLSNLVNDIFLGNITYYNRINERSAVGASFRYFSNGEIELRETVDQEPLLVKPNELLFDVSYSLRLSERFSMGITGRYIRSDLKLQTANEDATAASSFAVDISGYYQSEEIAMNSFDGRWRGGFNISNIGPKLKYDEVGSESNIPTNFAIGGGFDFILDPYNTIGVSLELNKLLVPTPPIRDSSGEIIAGKDDNVNFLTGMVQSWYDAPRGFEEEMEEFIWQVSAEYLYNDVFSVRAGYFHESANKGNRQFFTVGTGFKFRSTTLDVSYLINTSDVNNPLESTLRFSLTINLGDSYAYF